MNMLVALFISIKAIAAPFTVAVIDTGYNIGRYGLPLCTHIQSYDAITGQYGVPKDKEGHGTRMANIIRQHAGEEGYCFVIVKWTDSKESVEQERANALKAIKYLSDKKIDMISYSSSGDLYDLREQFYFKYMLNKGTIINVAAGNDHKYVTQNNPIYPGYYDQRINIVGSSTGVYSNYGPIVTVYEDGGNGCTVRCSQGTSEATAVHTGKMIKRLIK